MANDIGIQTIENDVKYDSIASYLSSYIYCLNIASTFQKDWNMIQLQNILGPI